MYENSLKIYLKTISTDIIKRLHKHNEKNKKMICYVKKGKIRMTCLERDVLFPIKIFGKEKFRFDASNEFLSLHVAF